MTDMTVSKTILQQLGGNRFVAMTGARNLTGHKNALSFRIPGNMTKKGINWVKITLNPMDTYDLEFGRIRGMRYHCVDRIDGIYDDMLPDSFRRVTGLETRMPRVIGRGA